jgi:cyclopropane-fatty-acyl-phospholipid synthase
MKLREGFILQRTMLYKFKSKVTADLIMLEPNGRQMLTLIGKSESGSLSKGILEPQDMPAAIFALERAIAEDEEVQQQRLREALAAGEKVARSDVVSLRQRAVPFLDMLRRCHAAGKAIVWGV